MFYITRLRLDLSGLNAHLYKINSPQVDSPNCRCEPSPETVKHYFFFCPKYVVQRTELERSLINYIKDYVKLTVCVTVLTVWRCRWRLTTAAAPFGSSVLSVILLGTRHW